MFHPCLWQQLWGQQWQQQQWQHFYVVAHELLCCGDVQGEAEDMWVVDRGGERTATSSRWAAAVPSCL
ncbi:unnamed protein product [Closterium sp. Yama58-4]|nr:unnamed protein product [Closterium sp. Yama58-4]